MWPATPNKKINYFKADIHIKSIVDHKSSTLNQLTTIFNLTSLDLSCSLRQNKYFKYLGLCRSAVALFSLLGLLDPCASRAATANLWFFVLAPNRATRGTGIHSKPIFRS